MHAVILDNSPPATRRTHMLGTMVDHIGDDHFLPALMAFCSEAAGANDCSLLVHRGPEPELAGAISIAGSLSRELGDWYVRSGLYRVEPSLELARSSCARLLLHSLNKYELPDVRWRDRYERSGWSDRVSLLVALDDGWVFMNAYRAPGCSVSMENALQAFGEQGPILAATVRRHVTAKPAPTPSQGPAEQHWATLSERERQVVDAILAGANAKECARRLGLSPTSVVTYRQRAFDKLGIRRQVQLFQLLRGAPDGVWPRVS